MLLIWSKIWLCISTEIRNSISFLWFEVNLWGILKKQKKTSVSNIKFDKS